MNHGFVVFPPSQSPESQANRSKTKQLINNTLNQTFPDAKYPKNKEEAEIWVTAKSKIQSHPDILGLVDPDPPRRT